jgi:hypothetical protein
MKTVDYSSEAITRRLRQTEQLRRLSLSLLKAKKAHDEKLAAEKAADHEANDRAEPELPTEGDR